MLTCRCRWISYYHRHTIILTRGHFKHWFNEPTPKNTRFLKFIYGNLEIYPLKTPTLFCFSCLVRGTYKLSGSRNGSNRSYFSEIHPHHVKLFTNSQIKFHQREKRIVVFIHLFNEDWALFDDFLCSGFLLWVCKNSGLGL